MKMNKELHEKNKLAKNPQEHFEQLHTSCKIADEEMDEVVGGATRGQQMSGQQFCPNCQQIQPVSQYRSSHGGWCCNCKVCKNTFSVS